MIFFYFFKIIFDISTSKRSKRYKPHSILAKKKNSKFDKHSYKHNVKRSLLLYGQKLNLVDHLSPGDDNNVQRPEFGQVIINSNLSPWTEFYQTGIY